MADFFEIDFLEAGEKDSGDAITLHYREGSRFTYIHIVDGGYTEDGEKIVNHIRRYYNKPTYIDHVVLTHPDQDHALGLKKVLEEFSIGSLWMNRPWEHVDKLLPRFKRQYTRNGLIRRLKEIFSSVDELEKIAKEKDIAIRDVFQGAQIERFTVLAPSLDRYIDCIVDSDKTPEAKSLAREEARYMADWGEEKLKGGPGEASRENETSVVQFANLCGEEILLTGDAGVEALEEAYGYALKNSRSLRITLPGVDYFGVPHHGSRRNLSSEILDKWLGPKLKEPADPTKFSAVISVNQKDKEHPKKSVIRALIHRGAGVFRTNGTLCAQKNAPNRGWHTAPALEYPTDTED